MIENSRNKFKYLENEKRILGEIKSIFHHFKRVSVAKSCLRLESAPLKKEKHENISILFEYIYLSK